MRIIMNKLVSEYWEVSKEWCSLCEKLGERIEGDGVSIDETGAACNWARELEALVESRKARSVVLKEFLDSIDREKK